MKYATILFSGNQAAKAIAEDPVFHKRTKAIGIQYHFVREAIAEGIVMVDYIETDRYLAEINTKPLVRAILERLRDRIFCGIDIPTSVVKVRITEDLGCRVLDLVEFSLFNLACCYFFVHYPR